MRDEQQFRQLILQYKQLSNGSDEIKKLIEKEDFDSAITMIKAREAVFLNCKCMRKFLEFSEEEEKELNMILDELRLKETNNIKMLEQNMQITKEQITQSRKNMKIQNAYEMNESSGTIINYFE